MSKNIQINVISRAKAMSYFLAERSPESKTAWMISINGPHQPMLFAGRNRTLNMRFSDQTPDSGDLCASDILFTEEMAKEIFTFAETIPNDSILYIHCNAGICRSGAVGEVLNIVLNDDDRTFYDRNKEIGPNPWVKAVMMRSAGLTPISCDEY